MKSLPDEFYFWNKIRLKKSTKSSHVESILPVFRRVHRTRLVRRTPIRQIRETWQTGYQLFIFYYFFSSSKQIRDECIFTVRNRQYKNNNNKIRTFFLPESKYYSYFSSSYYINRSPKGFIFSFGLPCMGSLYASASQVHVLKMKFARSVVPRKSRWIYVIVLSFTKSKAWCLHGSKIHFIRTDIIALTEWQYCTKTTNELSRKWIIYI
jgi:hypothetical protein